MADGTESDPRKKLSAMLKAARRDAGAHKADLATAAGLEYREACALESGEFDITDPTMVAKMEAYCRVHGLDPASLTDELVPVQEDPGLVKVPPLPPHI